MGEIFRLFVAGRVTWPVLDVLWYGGGLVESAFGWTATKLLHLSPRVSTSVVKLNLSDLESTINDTRVKSHTLLQLNSSATPWLYLSCRAETYPHTTLRNTHYIADIHNSARPFRRDLRSA